MEKANDSQTVPELTIPVSTLPDHAGYRITGIRKALRCLHPHGSIYALIYRVLVRAKQFRYPDAFLSGRKMRPTEQEQVYLCAVTILMLIRHNLYADSDTVAFNSDFPAAAVPLALRLIRYYDEIFSAIAGIPPYSLKYKSDPALQITYKPNADSQIRIVPLETACDAREIWYNTPIRYRLEQKNRAAVQKLLQILSPYPDFLEGQYEALCALINTAGNAVCILPTGSGKSLIFYLASFLQPLPMFVIAPNALLISDQLRNLQTLHSVDDAVLLEWTDEQDFSDYTVQHYINYLTPETLQCRSLFTKLLHFDKGTFMDGVREIQLAEHPLLSYIVLDEVHSLSKWGHEFYPEYLMLAQHLQHYAPHIPLLGFTATANYAVAADLQKQLSLDPQAMISTLQFERYQITFFFCECESAAQIYEKAAEQITMNQLLQERTIVFVKNAAAAEALQRCLSAPAAMLIDGHSESYMDFIGQKCDTLIAGHSLGVGINLPDIRSIIHIGLPFSKNDYVQEIGRAGRAGEDITSYVFYLQAEGNAPAVLTDRSLTESEKPQSVSAEPNDYDEILSSIYPFSSQDALTEKLNACAAALLAQNRALSVQSIPNAAAAETKQLYYMLFSIGIIDDWYLYRTAQAASGETEIMVNLFSSAPEAFSDPDYLLKRSRKRLPAYLTACDADQFVIQQAEKAPSLKHQIQIYAQWYFQQYLYQHRETFLDLYDFIVQNRHSENEEISAQIKDYYVLPFAKIRSASVLFLSLDEAAILQKIRRGIPRETVFQLESSLSAQYQPKLDLAVLLGKMRYGSFDASRADRVFRMLELNEAQIQEIFIKLYAFLHLDDRIRLLNWAESCMNQDELIDRIYAVNAKDRIYYGLTAKLMNLLFERR